MAEPNLNEITNRLSKLEKQNRCMKLTAAAATLIAAVMMITGAARSPSVASTARSGNVAEELRAKRIVVVDTEGRERIVMAQGEQGFMELSMYGSEGKTLVNVLAGADVANLSIGGGGLHPPFSVTASPLLSTIVLRDSKQQTRYSVVATRAGSRMNLNDRKGQQRFSFYADKKDSRLDLYDPAGKKRMSLTAPDQSAAGLALLASENDRQVTLAIDDTEGALQFFDSKAQPSLRVSANDAQSTVNCRHSAAGARIYLTANAKSAGMAAFAPGDNERIHLESRDEAANGGIIYVSNRSGNAVVQLNVDKNGTGAIGAYDKNGTGREFRP